MRFLKNTIDRTVPKLIENIGMLINPMLLQLVSEKNNLLIFYFHGLYANEDQKKAGHILPQNNITTKQFSEFIDYFLNLKYNFISIEDLLCGSLGEGPSVMITFDDGYFNNLLAVDVLEQYEVPAIFFVTTRNIMENTSMWADIIYKYRFKQAAGLKSIYQEQEFLKSYSYREINEYIFKNFGPESFKPWSDIDRFLTPEELTTLSKSPFVTIGNHTVNHAILINYEEEEIRKELLESNDFIEQRTGDRPLSLAFPNGDFNQSLLDIVEDLGFRVAFTTIGRNNKLPFENSKLLCLDRFMAEPSKVYKYADFCRLNYQPEMLYLSLKKRMLGKNKPVLH